jgi:murein DD-endopeptidase MepM/ murein hydrolase activator NlpD
MPRFSVSHLPHSPSTRARLLRVAAMVALSLGFIPLQAFDTTRCQLADGFDFPVGKPNAGGYYKARGFWPNGHLGEDWNGNGGGDSDEGDAIYAIGRGIVVLSEDVKVGWGNVVIIRHVYREITGKVEMVDSLYGHLLERKVRVGQSIERGQLVGTMGGNRGMYPVHLHLEVRKNLAIGMNRSKFARDYSNYHSPTAFINAHRQLPADFRRFDVPIDTFAPYGGELTDAQQSVSRSTSPTTFTHRSGVTRTGKGLSIPVVGGPTGYSPGSVAPGPTTGTTPTPKTPPTTVTSPGEVPKVTPPPAPTETKSDFWSRLRSKLGSGQVTPGVEDKR